MLTKKLFIVIIFSITLWLGGSFTLPVLAEETAPLESLTPLTGQATSTEATPTPEQAITTETTATTTPEILSTSTPETIVPTEEQATSTPLVEPLAPPPPLLPLESTPLPLAPEPPAPAAPAAESSQPAPSPVEGPTPTPSPPPAPPAPAVPSFDPATAPSKVTIRVLIPDGTPPSFPVFVTFVGVGNKNFGGKINANGELTVVMPSGRYYTELMVVNTEYVQGEDGPSFFLEANEERDFGAIRLISKTEQTPRRLEDKTLEENILAEAGSAKGIGKILVLIVKLLMKILEEVRNITSILMNR